MTTTRAQLLYPDAEVGSYSPFSDYQPIINGFGKVLVQVDDEDYSGDTRVILKHEDRFGFLMFGWGSCSGCDALQACDTFADVDSLIDNLESSIVWFDSLDELKSYVANDEERSGSYYFYHNEEWERFKQQVAELVEVAA